MITIKWLLISIIFLTLSISIGLSQDIESNVLQKSKELYREGFDYIQKGNHKAAITKFEEAIQLNPNLAEAYHDLAGCYRIVGEGQKAIEEMGKAVLLAPHWTSYRVDLGHIYIEQNDWESAISELNILWELDFEKAKELERDIVYSRAMPIREMRADGTFVFYKEYNEKTLKSMNLTMEGLKYLEDNQIERAKNVFEKAILLSPQEFWSYVSLAGLYAGQKEYGKAINLLESFLKDNPENPQVLHMLGSIYWALERYDDAILTWEKNKDIDEIIYLTRERFIKELRQGEK